MEHNWQCRKVMWIFWILNLLFGVTNTIKITKLNMPSTYIIEPTNKSPLILDCEYDIEVDKEFHGFVLKWMFNNAPMYQWIPPRPPKQFSAFKNSVNVTYEASIDQSQKHRAVYISKPTWNLTGQYTCSVSTYKSSDRKSANLQIIVPESDFQLSFKTDAHRMVTIRCSAFKIYPEPVLKINLENDSQLELSKKSIQDNITGSFFSSSYGKIHQDFLKSETSINCVLSIPGTNYTRRKETIYYEQQPQPDLLVTENDEIVEAILSLSSKPSANSATSIKWCCCNSCIAMLLFIICQQI